MSEVSLHEAEAEAARARIVDVVGELADRLSPQTIIREAKAEARQAVMDARADGLRKILGARDQLADAIDDVEDFVRDNALPVGLAAVAVGVAATAVRRAGQPHHDGYADAGGEEYTRYARGDDYAADAMRPRAVAFADRARSSLADVRDTVSEAANRAARAAAQARHAASERLKRASASIGEGASTAGERLASALDGLRDSATDTANAAARSARNSAAATSDTISDNPEATIFLALAGGALLALLAADAPVAVSPRD